MADRFRTILSLLGVCIGIFAIVAVFTLIDSLHSTISEGFDEYGADVLFVESQPLEPDLNEDGVFRWWDYISRPAVRYSEFVFLSRRFADIAFVSKASDGVVGVGGKWNLVVRGSLRYGRAISSEEISSGAPVVMIGSKVAEALFPGVVDPVGRTLDIYGRSFKVVGLYEESGSNMVTTVPTDEARLIPVKSLQRLLPEDACRNSIAVAGASADELKLLMRQVRRLRPFDPDDFAVNTLSFIVDELSEIFNMVSTLGWIVGIFSLLVGGFGIANIMFVGVEERTPQIGIQKALGARRRTIVLEYLREAVVLSLAGGVVGVLLVWVGTFVVPSSAVTIRLSLGNALLGLGISVVLGLLAGVAPAWRASRLSPLAAINHT